MNGHEVETLLAEISQSVAKKRRNGLYPPGLEEQLDAEFQNILSREELDLRETLLMIKNMVLDRLAVVDHLAMMIVEIEERLSVIEASLKSR